MKRALFALLASLVVASAVCESTEPTRIRITTWNLEWLPSGSAKEASAEQQNQRINEAADVLRPINPDIVLLQGNQMGSVLTSDNGSFFIAEED